MTMISFKIQRSLLYLIITLVAKHGMMEFVYNAHNDTILIKMVFVVKLNLNVKSST